MRAKRIIAELLCLVMLNNSIGVAWAEEPNSIQQNAQKQYEYENLADAQEEDYLKGTPSDASEGYDCATSSDAKLDYDDPEQDMELIDDISVGTFSNATLLNDDRIVDIPDPALKQALLNQGWDTNEDGEISEREMESQMWLDLSDSYPDICDLTGLEYAVNLYSLRIINSSICNIDAISGMAILSELDLENNKLTNIPDLSNLRLRFYFNDDDPIAMFRGNEIPKENFFNEDGSSKFSERLGEDWYDLNAYDATPVEFLDSHLKDSLISQGWDKNEDGKISKSEMKYQQRLEIVDDLGITNLTGLENATELRQLIIKNSQIENIDAITNLTRLTSLCLDNNRLTDIPDLRKLKDLSLYESSYEDGYVHSNPISMFSGNPIPRENFFNEDGSSKFAAAPEEDWYELNLFDFTIVNIPSIGLKHALIGDGIVDSNRDGELSISEMKLITDVSIDGGWSEEYADITELTGLEYATHLKSISITNTKLRNIDAIRKLSNISNLELIDNQLEDIPDLRGLTNVDLYSYSVKNGKWEYLPKKIFTGNMISKENFYNTDGSSKFAVEPGEDWYELNSYDDIVVEIPDIELKRVLIARNWDTNGDGELSKSEMKAQTSLYLYSQYPKIKDLTGLENATELTSIHFDNSRISNVDAMASLKKLTYLELTNHQLTDVSALSNLESLRYLDLRNNQITSISGLSGLSSLETLYLSNNQLTNIPDLRNLDQLSIYSTYEDGTGHTTYYPQQMFQGNRIPKENFFNADGTSKFIVEPGQDWYEVNAYDAVEVTIPDANFKKILIEKGLDTDENGELDTKELEKLTTLDISGYDISDITGIEKAINLQEFTAQKCKLITIPDLTPLTKLNLYETIWTYGVRIRIPRRIFTENKIPREEFMGKFAVEPEEDWLGLNSYDDTTVSFNDSELKKALINQGYDKNSDGELSVSEMSLITTLRLINLPIKDLSGLEYAQYMELFVCSDTQVSDISPLSKIKRIYSVQLSRNNITDISPLEDVEFYALSVCGNRLTNIPDFSKKLSLRMDKLMFSGNMIKKEMFSGKLPWAVDEEWLENNSYDNSKIIYFGNEKILEKILQAGYDTDGDGKICISEAKGIQKLNLSSCGLNDLIGLEFCTNLYSLNLRNNNITDFSILLELLRGHEWNWQYLDLSRNGITDISSFENLLTNSKGFYRLYLALNKNQIKDISSVSKFGSLNSLDVSDNQINDLQPVASLASINNLYACNNNLSVLPEGLRLELFKDSRKELEGEEPLNMFSGNQLTMEELKKKIPGATTEWLKINACDFQTSEGIICSEVTITPDSITTENEVSIYAYADNEKVKASEIKLEKDGEYYEADLYASSEQQDGLRWTKQWIWYPSQDGIYNLKVTVTGEDGSVDFYEKEIVVSSVPVIKEVKATWFSSEAGATVSSETDSAHIGDEVRIDAFTRGVVRKFSFCYIKNGVESEEVMLAPCWSTDEKQGFMYYYNYFWTPEEAGNYIWKITAYGEDGSKDSKELTVLVQADPLNLREFVAIPDTSATVGTKISLQTIAEGGTGTLQYQYFYKKYGKLTMIQAFKPDAICTWIPTEAGDYLLYALVKDETGSKVQVTKEFTVEQGFEITSFTTSLESPHKTNTQVTLKAESSGGEGTLKYQFFYKKDGVLTMIRAFKETAECTWIPKNVGTYTLYAVAQDSTGKKTQVTKDFVVEQGFAITDFTTSKTSPQPAGLSITLKAEVTGGEGKLQYQYFYKKDGALTMIRAFKESVECTWTPKEAGDYILYAVVKDSKEAKVQVTKDYTIEQGFEITEFKTSLNSPQKTGTSIILKAETAGGAGTQQYQYFYKKDEKLTMIQAFKANAECVWTPSEEGSYILYAVVKDETGSKVQVTKEFEIEQGFGISSFNISAASPQPAGTSITLSTDVTGGEGTLQYQYLYKKNGTLTMIQAFKAQREVVWKPADAGNYTLYVVVKDAGGNKKQVTKEYVIK